MSDYFRHSRAVIRSTRWRALRLAALRRDGWRCVKCGARGRLEVDHIVSVRRDRSLAFDLGNTQTLCVVCHARKTHIECGFPELSPERRAWRDLVEGT